MPWGHGALVVNLDFVGHALTLRRSDVATRTLPLEPQTVAQVHARYMEALHSLGVTPRMMPRLPAPTKATLLTRRSSAHGNRRDACAFNAPIVRSDAAEATRRSGA